MWSFFLSAKIFPVVLPPKGNFTDEIIFSSLHGILISTDTITRIVEIFPLEVRILGTNVSRN